MNRHAFLPAALLGTALAFSLTPATASAASAQRPNVLFIAVDDLRVNLGCYGDAQAITPNIDALADAGTLFDRAYCQQAICSPSRSSLLTGQRPDTIQVYDLHTHFRQAAPDTVTLPEYFKQNGYRTQGIGKIYHWGLDDPQSWTVPINLVGDRVKTDRPRSGAYVTPHGIEVNEAVKAKPKTGPYAGYQWGLAYESQDIADEEHGDGALTVAAVRTLGELAKNKDEPFFLAVGYLKPHLPFLAPSKYWDLYPPEDMDLSGFTDVPPGIPGIALTKSNELRTYAEIPREGPLPLELQINLLRGYYACTSFIDAQVGLLIDALKKNGQWDNTIVILWGDHGFHLGDKTIWGKHTNFEEAVRAPLIIRTPDGTQGQVAEGLCEFVDVYPTLCELAGLDIPDDLAGVSLQPVMDDPDETVKPYAFSQYPRGPNIWGYTVRTERYRYTVWEHLRDQARMGVELYDHTTDPMETVNLARDPAYAATVEELDRILDAQTPTAFPARQIIH